MKIAMFTDAYFPRVNGVGVSVKCFGQALAKMGNEVCVVCPAYDKQKEILIEKDEVKGFFLMRIPSTTTIFSKEDRKELKYLPAPVKYSNPSKISSNRFA